MLKKTTTLLLLALLLLAVPIATASERPAESSFSPFSWLSQAVSELASPLLTWLATFDQDSMDPDQEDQDETTAAVDPPSENIIGLIVPEG